MLQWPLFRKTHSRAGALTYPGLPPCFQELLVFCESTSPVVQIPGWNTLICQTTQDLPPHLWRMAVEKTRASKMIRSALGPDTSDTEVDVQLRHVISRAGLSKAAVTGVLEQRPVSEPAAHKEPPLTQWLAVLHYGPVENVPIYQPVNGDITGTWGTEPNFISHQICRAPTRCRSACSVVFMQRTTHLLLPFRWLGWYVKSLQ